MKHHQDQRTRWLSSFDSVEEVLNWLLAFGVHRYEREVRKTWESRQVALEAGISKDYKLMITGRRGHKPNVCIYRRGPKRPRRQVAKQRGWAQR